jgi:CBS domain-containing protein
LAIEHRRIAMKIQDIMTTNVECVWPDDTLQEAALKMKEMEIGPLPVCDGGRILGMITDRDITIRSVALGCDPRSTMVRDIMTREIIRCYEDEECEEAERLMETRQVRRILVVNRDEQLVGILSLADLAATGSAQRVGEVLQEVSEPAISRR